MNRRFLKFLLPGGLLVGAVLTGCGRWEAGHGGPVVYDLAADAARTPLRRDISRLEFSARDRRRGLLTSGWSRPEVTADGSVTYAWALGAIARATLPVYTTDLSWLIFRCRPYLTKDVPSQRVRVRLNGKGIGSFRLREGLHTYAVRLPPGLVKTGNNGVSLRFAHPRQEGRAPHEKALRTVAFDALYLSPVRNPDALSPSPDRSELGVDGTRIVQPVRSELSFPVTVPRQGRLELAFDSRIEAPASGNGVPLKTRIFLRIPGFGDHVLWTLRDQTDRSEEIRLDLAAHVGKRGDLVFQVLGTSAARGGVVWERPRLLGERGARDTKSHVVLIVVDTLRADQLGLYGGEAVTPHIDALAASGVGFERAYAHAPMTVPSHASMFTSLLPSEHGARVNTQVLRDEHLTLAEVLQRSGRETAAFVSLGVLQGRFGFAQGFDEYHDRFDEDWWKTAAEMNRAILPWLEKRDAPFFLWAHYSDPHEPYNPPGLEFPRLELLLDGEPRSHVDVDASVHTLRFKLAPGRHELRLRAAAGASPAELDLWEVRLRQPEVTLRCGERCEPLDLGSQQPGAYRVRPAASLVLDNTAGRTLEAELHLRARLPTTPEETRQRYRAEIEYVDREIGRLLDTLRRRGLLEDTLIVLTSDHGEGLGDHDLGGHGEQLYDSLLRVPLILSFPGRLPSGRMVSEPVCHSDLLPTVLDLLGIPDSAPRVGRSLVALVRDGGEEASAPPPIFAETFRPQALHDLKAVVHGGFKMIHTAGEERFELYELTADPGELRDLAPRRRTTVEGFHALVEARMVDAGVRRLDSVSGELSAEDVDRLRALGYVR